MEHVDIREIFKALPHRYPFLLIDRVLEFEVSKQITAIKNVTFNEPFFQGHFPNHPVMPGVLVLEAMAQASGILNYLSAKGKKSVNPLYYLVKIDKARFSRIVSPGDQLTLLIEQKRMIRGMGLFSCRAEVDGELVARAEMMCAERSE